MHPELAPSLSPLAREHAEVDAIRVREQQIARLQLAQRHAIAALYAGRAGSGQRFVADELALAWRRSPRQGSTRVVQALGFASFPAVHPLVADGTWLMDHADAVVDELGRSGLAQHAQQQVLALVLSRRVDRTPYELRVAVRMAVLALFPGHAWEHAKKAHADRDVQSYPDGPGGASLVASGSAADVAAMMASIDALCWPVAPGDERSLAQRRFDAIRALVCGQAQPGQWQVHVLTELTTIAGDDDHPAELVGHGPVPAGVARQAAASGELRRIVVDTHGRLVAVDSLVHRPDLRDAPIAPFPVHPHDDRHAEPAEPDPDAPSVEDLAWHEAHTDRRQAYAEQDAARAAAARRRPDSALPEIGPSPLEIFGQDLRPAPVELLPDHPHGKATLASGQEALFTPTEAATGTGTGDSAPESMPARWSEPAFHRALHRIATDPLTPAELSTDRYRVPTRLKRFLVLRDRTCVFPGCPRLAQRCDSDHLRPWPLGPTSEPNLADECEHHHQGRHDHFTVQRLPDGTFRWTTPTGHTYDRPPRPVLDNHHDRPPPDPEPQP